MEDTLVRLLVPAIAPVSGRIGTYFGLKNRALLAEVRKELAELENRIITRINGTYVRAGECTLHEANVQQKIDALKAAMRRDDF
jgi:hypothetical protein